MRITLSLLLCLLFPFLMEAQAPVAAFTADSVTGCSPLYVRFTDQSTGSPTSWNWDLGNGTLSIKQTPDLVTYLTGTYTVTLTVRNANGIASITKTNLIVANPSPSVSFSADKTLDCLPSSIKFTDASVANAGTLNKWQWDFGDGTTGTGPTPTHSYTATGFYNIYLKVTSTSGCSKDNSIPRYIRIVNGVKANFNPVGPSTCKAPFNVAFSNLTSGPGKLTYSWDLGNGSFPAQTSPVGTYAAGGNYTVKLKAKSDIGCADSIQKVIPINGITTSFSSADSTCLGSAVIFKSTSVPTPVKVLWNFGDGTGSSLLNPPPKTYGSAGIYPVKLVSNFTGCTDSVTKNIKIYSIPGVDFYSNNSNNCKPPFTVVFQNLAPDVATAQWNFGDGGTSNSNAPTVSHTYTTTGIFTVTLTITDSKGCTNTVSKEFVHIQPPVAGIGGVPAGVCVGQPFKPVSASGAYDAITGYAWDFGDGSPVDNAAAPSHSYATAGVYNVKLTITTSGGCTASYTANNAVQVGNPPVIDFSANQASLCRSGAVTFTNLTTPAGSLPVLWDFNDGTTSTLLNPLPQKFPDTGFYSIKLRVTSNGCTDSLIKTNFVHVLPPVANFGYKTTDCINRSAVSFVDSSVTSAAYPPVSYLWSFGDPLNTTSPAPGNTSFAYPPLVGPNATYTATLIVNNGACADTVTRQVFLFNETAAFTMSTPTPCKNANIVFSSTNTPAYFSKYEWIVDGAPPVNAGASYTILFPLTGNHTVVLQATDINGCISTATKTFNVISPTAKFGAINNGGCKGNTVTFSDSSSSSATINNWTFDFGDGSTQSYVIGHPAFTHVYADTGNYNVKLTISDNLGCGDSYLLTNGVFVTKPAAAFYTDLTTFCPGTPLQFNDSSMGKGLSWNWSFGDGGTSSLQNPLHQYNGKDSVYSVKLVIKDTVGCTDSVTRTNYISIRAPKVGFSVKDTTTLCPPLETKFYFKGADYDSFTWDFGDGTSQSSLDTVSHFYNSYGQYTAKLYVTGYGGCVDSASTVINVINPFKATTVNFDPKIACNELTVNFSIVPPAFTRFDLFFGDGGIDSSGKTSLQHFYSLPNVYSPYILLADSVGCQVIIGGLGDINIKGAVPLFGMSKNKFCDSGTVYFTDYSQDGNDKIVTRSWDFGDGVSGVLTKDAVHTYTKPGLYVVKLTVTTQYPCSQTFADTVRILATPQPIINSADGICNNLIIDFSGSLLVPPDTAIAWKWDLGQGQTSVQQNVSVNFPDTGLHLIKLQATNSLGCKGDTSKNVMVFPLPVIKITGDTSIISGGLGTVIPVTYSTNVVSYAWTPATNLSCTDCPNPYASPKFSTVYTVKVTDANGCVSSRNIKLLVICNNKNFFIPNTFSPNNDGANDRFYPRGTGLDHIQALRIFNRWGELVFEKRNFPANDAPSGWDGTYKGKAASSDTYIYMIDIICENANIITYKGNVTLIR